MRSNYLVIIILSILLAACAPRANPNSAPYPSPGTRVDPAAVSGSIRGNVVVQGRISHQGVTVTISKAGPVVTLADGSYVVTGIATPGQYQVTVDMPGFLRAQGQVEIAAGSDIKVLPTVTLLAGDLNRDDSINLLDLVLLSSAIGNLHTANPPSDLNADGTIDLFDLMLVANNLDHQGPIPLE